jgi:hypothetical protein
VATIEKVDWTDNTDVSKGAFIKNFNLTDWADSLTLELSGGRYEDLNGFPYKIVGGDFAIDDSAATSDGTWYVHIVEDGVTPGNAIAYVDANAGTYRDDLGGYYYDVGGGRLAKVWLKFERTGSGANYEDKTVIQYIHGDRTSGNMDIGNDLTVANHTTLNGKTTFNGGYEILETRVFEGTATSGSDVNIPFPSGWSVYNTTIISAFWGPTSAAGFQTFKTMLDTAPAGKVAITLNDTSSATPGINILNGDTDITYKVFAVRYKL